MAIVKMSNFNLFAFDSERDVLLKELQNFGYVHFNNLENKEDLIEEGLKIAASSGNIGQVDEEISKIKYAIDIFSKYFEKEPGLKGMMKGRDNVNFEDLEKRALAIDYLPVYQKLRTLTKGQDDLRIGSKDLELRMEELNHWKGLNFPLKDLKESPYSTLVMGTCPKKMKDKLDTDLLDLEYTYYETISEDKDNFYILAMSLKEEGERLNEILRSNGFSYVNLVGKKTPLEEIQDIEGKLKDNRAESESLTNEIKKLSVNLPDFEKVYEYLMNKKLRLSVSGNFLTTERVNIIDGYIPTDMKEKFEKAVEESLKDGYYLTIEEASDEDPEVPVLLKNSKFSETFESLTTMYALPRYNELDPTPLLAPFYLAFFGMMVGDAGYGLILLIVTFVALKFANLEESQEKFVRFFYYLSFSTIVWGAVFGSYFGGVIPIKGLMDPANQYQELLVISMVFGLIHLFFGLGVSAYLKIRDKDYAGALFDIGFWYMAVPGGIVFLLTMVVSALPIVNTISKIVMIVGMVGIVLTGGRDSKSVGAKAVGGLFSLYGISSYVGDLVSYSRLMALGLAGGFISGAINMMVGMLFEIGFIGIIFGIVVFLVGQVFNLFLSLLGAYVHTSRLIYVEFFSKFYEGGGKNFNIFRNKAKYINLK